MRLFTVMTLCMVAVAGCSVPATYSPPAPPTRETRPARTIRLVSATPALARTAEGTIRLDETTVSGTLQYVRQSYTRSEYTSSGRILVGATGDVQLGFSLTALGVAAADGGSAPLGLSVYVRNGSTTGIQIDWNAVTIIATGGRAYPVIHRGVRMADRASVQPASTVPPGAVLDDFVYPRELLAFSSGRYGGWHGAHFFETMRTGEQFTLYLPVKRGGAQTEHQFVFEVAGSQ